MKNQSLKNAVMRKEDVLDGKKPKENLYSSRAIPVVVNADSVPTTKSEADLICFSHLRWDFVYQRPQHLLSRFARERRVFFVEEPIFDKASLRLEMVERAHGLKVAVPHLPEGLVSEIAKNAVLQEMVDRLFKSQGIRNYLLWYYTPMALSYTEHLKPLATIYDCMDELSAFKDAPPSLRTCERNLFQRADLVFTGGQSLYEAKCSEHKAVHAFPSSIDRDHFARAREINNEPEDQKRIPRPRLGFCGVIDERFDRELLDQLSQRKPEWQFVMVGPVVKIDPESLPRRSNIHYLGSKSYKDLPGYMSGWDVALLLFARNEATRFISPTKTPEYLAAGRPVVSTSIRDVVRPYGELGLVRIADTAEEFVKAIQDLLAAENDQKWLKQVDDLLCQNSWDHTWERMSQLIEEVIATQRIPRAKGMQAASVKTQAARATSIAS